jgi:FAD/FMN-containing dehydrogenase
MKTVHHKALERFGERVSFDPTERRLYGHDVGALPSLVAPLLGDTTPDAVVQPESEEELIELATWATAEGVALTPRGKATSGYGGAIPTRRGVVVDFHRMRRVLHVDPAAQEVTVEPGITWEQLDRMLAEHELTLRLYPTSYPSSTVGGWLAQGGAGIGSFEYGYFSQSVVAARLVLPNGHVRELCGPALELVADAEGITGLISQVTLKVMPREEIRVAAVTLPDARAFQRFVEAMIARTLPLWSLGFVNPTMAALRNRAPESEHDHAPAPALPETYVATLAFRARDALAVYAALPALVTEQGGQILGEELAMHEWESRFKIMTIKRLGPHSTASQTRSKRSAARSGSRSRSKAWRCGTAQMGAQRSSCSGSSRPTSAHSATTSSLAWRLRSSPSPSGTAAARMRPASTSPARRGTHLASVGCGVCRNSSASTTARA